MAAAKESPLVAILSTSEGKSLVFIVPAILSRSGVTIVVGTLPPYVIPLFGERHISALLISYNPAFAEKHVAP